MLRLPKTVRVFVATRPIHFSVGIDKLVQRVRDDLGGNLFAKRLYCFFNHRRTRVKLLVWDRNGFWTLSKRLERGRFEQLDSRASWLEISREDLVMLLAGIHTKTARFNRYFVREIRINPRDAAELARTPQ